MAPCKIITCVRFGFREILPHRRIGRSSELHLSFEKWTKWYSKNHYVLDFYKGIDIVKMLRADEQTRLLGGRRETEREPDIIHGPAECHPSPLSFTWTDFKALRLSPLSILPLSLFASHGIAVTIATTIYGYAYILCRDPAHCQESEQSAYAGTVAIATLIASLCGLLALGVLEHISRQNRKIGLMLWFTCRAMSIVMLAIGGTTHLLLGKPRKADC